MSDFVKTEAEALDLAEAFLAKQEALRKRHYEKWSQETGKSIPFIPYVFTLIRVESYDSGWLLKYDVKDVDPGIWALTVNKASGEIKFDVF